VIDLHSHILPGLDDGAPDLAASVTMARMAAADGVRTMVGTPHVREDYPFAIDRIAEQTRAVNEALRARDITLEVKEGAEVAVSQLPDLDDAALKTVCLGDGPYILVESPYLRATDLFETSVFDLQLRGLRPMLAHPERSPSFQRHPDRLAAMVYRGVLCSVTSASMAGRFGRTVQQFTRTLFESGLVHNVASDSHDARMRPPGLGAGFRVMERELPGVLDQMDWFTSDVPAAILAGVPLPARPVLPGKRRSRWSRGRDQRGA
jgi:protein-tyrosine phosphatase